MSDNLHGLFSERPLPKAPPDSPGEPKGTPSLFWRRVLPIVLFVAIIAGIAWITQNLPNRSNQIVKPNLSPKKPAELDFLVKSAVWESPDPEKPYTFKEFEPYVEGHYDFPFRNPSDRAVKLTFVRTSCDCSQLKVAVLDAAAAEKLPTDPKHPIVAEESSRQWKVLSRDDKDSVDVPAHGGGLVRVFWHARKGPGEMLKLTITVGMAPVDNPEDYSTESLAVPIIVALPVCHEPAKVNFGPLAPGATVEETVYFHSATRDKLPLVVDPSQVNELFQVELYPLDQAKVKEFEKKLRDEHIETRLLSATKAVVRVREQNGGKQLDQGWILKPLPVRLDGYEGDTATPMISWIVRGEVEVGVGDNAGRVVFPPFSATNGEKKIVPLWTEMKGDLTVEKIVPPYLEAKVTRSEKESTPARNKWLLEVRVPPGSLLGALPDDSVVVLRTPADPPRRIRIPIVATGSPR
jgi:hypothetical protein